MYEKRERDSNYYNTIIAENVNEMIRILDLNFKIIYVNEAAHFRILGFAKEELIGKFTLDFIHFKDRANVINYTRENIKHGEGSIEFRCRRKNGSFIWVRANGKIIPDKKETDKILIVLREINEQKKLELKLKRSERNLRRTNYELHQLVQKRTKELNQSEKKYRDLFNTSPDPILLVSINGLIVDCNQSMIDTYGYAKEELVNYNFRDLGVYVNVDLKWLISKFSEIFSKRMVDPIELNLKKKNGENCWVKVNGSIIEIGDIILYQAILQDITENKKRELDLLDLSKYKSEMLKTTSHELKSPLTSIKGYTNLLLKLKSDFLDEESLSMLQIINSGCERINTLINNLLESSKLESSKSILKKSYENLSDLIKIKVHELMHLASFKNQEISITINENLNTYVEKEKILIVISNLLNNAINYTPAMGKIWINSDLSKDKIIISIKDNGVGFTEDEKSKIFKQFGKVQRVDQNYDQYLAGSGLGLYISKKIIQLHGGKIWMDSNGRNQGATFYFSLPIIERQETE